MPDPATVLTILGLAAYPTKKATDVAADLIGKMLTPSAEHKGEALRQWFQRRSERALNVVLEADAISY